ncbi:hypothetical protein L596_030852 [Steinernema carpocapsae]|uniref:Neuronal membrane glycoprotein M6-b n=1 Tax=Steinernema carpocapsae TaxID=34508 RepID=A0A4U5LNC3_STECR|nr:hypothetical protein L596_030852 [Steinernema carpocapsae]
MMHHKTKNQQEYVVDRNLLQVAVPPNHDGCHARTPYASLMATLLCFIGVVMFTVMMIRSFNGCIEQFRRSTNIDRLPGLDKARIVFYVIVTIMCLAALFLLLVGFLSTGSTREELYGTAHTRRGGRVVCAIAMVLSYLLTIMWIAIITFTSILIFAYAIFSNLCLSLDGYSENNCLDFRVFHPLFKDVVKNDLNFCGGNVQQFCAFSTTLITYVVVAHIGGFIVVLGLLHFLACHAANYAHVNNNKRYLELRGVIYAEDGYETSNTPVGRPAVEPQFSAASVVRVQETFRKPSPAKMPVQRFHAPPNKTMTDEATTTASAAKGRIKLKIFVFFCKYF